MQHAIVDCSNNGKVAYVDATPAEVDQILAQQAEHAARRQAEYDQKAADQAAIQERAESDPAFAALARRLGVSP